MKVGEKILLLTVTDYWLGEIVSIDGPYTVTLASASLIRDTGRFHQFLRDGRADGMEVEPVPDEMSVQVQWLTNIHWPHPLLREVV